MNTICYRTPGLCDDEICRCDVKVESSKAIETRDRILKLLAPFFPESGSAGVYISKKPNAEMGVAGNQITITFYDL